MSKLTDKKLKSLLGKTRPTETTIADGGGLAARLLKDGGISWRYRYRRGGRDGHAVVIGLGEYPAVSLKTVRGLRDKFKNWRAEGKDPKDELERERRKNMGEALTVADLFNIWMDAQQTEERTAYQRRKSMERYILPIIGTRPVDKCTRIEWVECFLKAKSAPATMVKLLKMCQRMLCNGRALGYCTSRELDDLTRDALGAPSGGERVRCHSDKEIADIWNATSEENRTNAEIWTPDSLGLPDTYYADMARLLLVFGCRTMELRLSRIEEWDTKDWVWSVPREHNKKDRHSGAFPVFRPVPVAVRPLITQLINENHRTGYLLGTVRNEATVSSKGRRIYKKLGHAEKWSFHDLRRTFTTRLNDLEIDNRVVELLVGHRIRGTEGVYNRSKYMNQKRAAMDRWIAEIERLADSQEEASEGNVLPFRRRYL
ncbi:integrase arm-type DNA-binding domain-containing protein [Escherichia coli]|nr:integrase arm-type DNA-binding domain-containing protein [Escherichia coli]